MRQSRKRGRMNQYPDPSTSFDDRLRENLKQSSQNEILRLLETADEHELHALQEAWDIFSHEHQLPPACANNGEAWTTWLLIGGRGAGKTRAGAE